VVKTTKILNNHIFDKINKQNEKAYKNKNKTNKYNNSEMESPNLSVMQLERHFIVTRSQAINFPSER
jgi:hypothetical protein